MQFSIGFQKLFDHGKNIFEVLLLEFASTPRSHISLTKICKKGLIVFLFRRHEIFSIVILSGILACS